MIFFREIIKIQMSKKIQEKSNKVMVNQQVKLLVRNKKQKFISLQFPCMHTDRSQLTKNNAQRDKKRRDHSLHKQPIWQSWGTEEYNNQRNIGLFGQQQVFGNHLNGKEWVEQQKRRQKQFILEPGTIKQIHKQNAEQVQYTYMEPATPTQKLDFLRKRGYQFEDTEFPPNNNSLNGEYGIDPEWDVIQWKRIRFMISQSEIFEGKVQPADIKQGYLGDCYFLAGLAALAERPDRIFNLFLLKQKNQLSFYSVKILYKGKWRMVDLDDNVPFVFSTPAFSRAINGQLWVLLLQKAWAKIYNSYKNIQAGYPEQPLHSLTGAPIKQLHLSQKSQKLQQHWKYLLQSSLKEYAMVASSNTDSDEHISPTGIFRAHAYTFLNAIEVETSQGRERLVQLRNTWGRGEWKGKWADDDAVWNMVSQTQKFRVRYKKDCEDGIFFMSFADFIKEFRILTIAQINDNSSYIYQSCYDPQSKGVYFSLKILQQANYCLQIDKTPQRSLSLQKQKSYRYPQSQLQIGRINETCSQMLEGCSDKKKTMFKTYRLFPGEYVVYAKIKFDPKFQEDFQVTLAVYGEFSCGVAVATADQAYKLTGRKNQWDGIKKIKPQAPKIPFQIRSTTFIQIKNTKKQTSEEQITQGQQTVKIVNNKPYRNQSQFERKNPLIMFGFQKLLTEQTPCYKQAVGQLQKNWKSKSKSKSKSKQINTKHQHPTQNKDNPTPSFPTTPNPTTTNQLPKKLQHLKTKSKQKTIINKTFEKIITKQKIETHNISKNTVQVSHFEQTVDSRTYYSFVKNSQIIKDRNHLKSGNIGQEKNLGNGGVGVQAKKQASMQRKQGIIEQKMMKQKNTIEVSESKQFTKIQQTTVTRNQTQHKQNQLNSKNVIEKTIKQQEKGKAGKTAYFENLIQTVLGFQIPSYRKQHQGKQEENKEQKQSLQKLQKDQTARDKQNKAQKSQKNSTISYLQSQKVANKSMIKENPLSQIPKNTVIKQNEYKQEKSPKLQSKAQINQNKEKEVAKVQENKETEQQQKYKKEVRDSLKKRRKQVDVLRYPDEAKSTKDILFDLWPKLLS